jgi:hypothetical protein
MRTHSSVPDVVFLRTDEWMVELNWLVRRVSNAKKKVVCLTEEVW